MTAKQSKTSMNNIGTMLKINDKIILRHLSEIIRGGGGDGKQGGSQFFEPFKWEGHDKNSKQQREGHNNWPEEFTRQCGNPGS